VKSHSSIPDWQAQQSRNTATVPENVSVPKEALVDPKMNQ
jgi:hypothetical protein